MNCTGIYPKLNCRVPQKCTKHLRFCTYWFFISSRFKRIKVMIGNIKPILFCYCTCHFFIRNAWSAENYVLSEDSFLQTRCHCKTINIDNQPEVILPVNLLDKYSYIHTIMKGQWAIFSPELQALKNFCTDTFLTL